MSFDPYEFDRDYGQSSRMESIGQYTAKTFLWMVLGLLVTFGIALLGWVTNATLYALAYVPYIHLIVLIATIVLSITMVSRIEKMSVGTARGIFIAFSALFGFTMSMYLYIFEFGSLIFVFLATAAYFAVLAAYGYFTKADLTRLRPILFTGLVFLFVFALVSLFIPGFTALDRIFCLAGIAIFLGYSMGSAPIVSYHYGAQNREELKSLLRKAIFIVAIAALCMFAAGELLAAPLSRLFVAYDEELLQMTTHAFAIFSFSFLFSGFAINGSSFFTALNDGLTSALISFLRTLVFQVAAVLLFPLLWGLDGIWFSIVAAEIMAVLATIFFLLKKQKKYGY
mgnify:CR=1 FL=1